MHTLTPLKTTLILLRIMIPTKIILDCRANLEIFEVNLNLDSASGSAFTSIAVGDEDIFDIRSERRQESRLVIRSGYDLMVDED
jgi:hypothetical protein